MMSRILLPSLVLVTLWFSDCSALGDAEIEQTATNFVPASVTNPGQLPSGFGELEHRSRDIVDEVPRDPISTGGVNGWGSYAPFHYQRTRIDPFSYGTGLHPWSGTFFGGPEITPGGLNEFGRYGIGAWNLGTPIGLGYLGMGQGVAIGTISGDPARRVGGLPYVGYGAQGEGGVGYGLPLSSHPIYKLFPGLYHPPPQNVFF